MKKTTVWALALLLMLVLAGCAQNRPEEGSAQSSTPTEQTQLPPAQPETVAEPERPAVEGNGGYFVRVDGKVWFRRYDEGVIDESQLWGNFLSVWPTHAVTSMLCCYDESGGAVNEAFADDGFGQIWFGVDGFYLMRSADGGPREAYFKSLDGAETVLRAGYVSGVSDNGRFAAIFSEGEADEGRLYVYEGTDELRFVPNADHYLEFCAIVDDGTLLYLDRGGDTLCELRTDGTICALGALPTPEEYGGYGYAWELEQCLVNDAEVWCTFGSYEGTGHFLSDVLCLRAKLDTENSIEVIEDQPTTEYPFVPKLWRGEDGSVRRTEYAPGELEIPYEGGDLVWHDSADSERLLVSGLLPSDDYSEDRMIEQTAETLGSAAYLIVAEAYRDAENDIGWRMAYRPGELRYLRVPLHENAEVEPLDGREWALPPTAAEVYESMLGTWALTATEVEGDRSDTLPDGTFEVLEFRADGTAVISGTEYNNEFPSMELLPTNSADAGVSVYGLLFTGGENDDMLWTYFEGDTLVGTTMIHFEVDGGTDSYSRTGFYERSEG